MIKIKIGNLGSGKTASTVKDIIDNYAGRRTFSNIIAKKIPHMVELKPEMIIKREIVGYKKNRMTQENTAIYDMKFNEEFWTNLKEPINLVLDEAHTIMNSRKSMSKVNVIVTDWLALARKLVGETESGSGELTFITQLPYRLDSIARDMATNVSYHICNYIKQCKKCSTYWQEDSDMPEHLHRCPACGSFELFKHSHEIEVFEFEKIRAYEDWEILNKKSYFKHYFIVDIDEYFPLYNTSQWQSLFSKYY